MNQGKLALIRWQKIFSLLSLEQKTSSKFHGKSEEFFVYKIDECPIRPKTAMDKSSVSSNQQSEKGITSLLISSFVALHATKLLINNDFFSYLLSSGLAPCVGTIGKVL